MGAVAVAAACGSAAVAAAAAAVDDGGDIVRRRALTSVPPKATPPTTRPAPSLPGAAAAAAPRRTARLGGRRAEPDAGSHVVPRTRRRRPEPGHHCLCHGPVHTRGPGPDRDVDLGGPALSALQAQRQRRPRQPRPRYRGSKGRIAAAADAGISRRRCPRCRRWRPCQWRLGQQRCGRQQHGRRRHGARAHGRLGADATHAGAGAYAACVQHKCMHACRQAGTYLRMSSQLNRPCACACVLLVSRAIDGRGLFYPHACRKPPATHVHAGCHNELLAGLPLHLCYSSSWPFIQS
eukprot:366573-Chlamydomonas_euryale.AAC.2